MWADASNTKTLQTCPEVCSSTMTPMPEPLQEVSQHGQLSSKASDSSADVQVCSSHNDDNWLDKGSCTGYSLGKDAVEVHDTPVAPYPIDACEGSSGNSVLEGLGVEPIQIESNSSANAVGLSVNGGPLEESRSSWLHPSSWSSWQTGSSADHPRYSWFGPARTYSARKDKLDTDFFSSVAAAKVLLWMFPTGSTSFAWATRLRPPQGPDQALTDTLLSDSQSEQDHGGLYESSTSQGSPEPLADRQSFGSLPVCSSSGSLCSVCSDEVPTPRSILTTDATRSQLSFAEGTPPQAATSVSQDLVDVIENGHAVT
jgi:hypothetical protein